jgi:hypothetical protein
LSRRGGGLKIGDTRAFLRIIGIHGTQGKGKGNKKQFYWEVECLFKGPKCKEKMKYSTKTFKANTSCGCKRDQELIKVGGIAARNHPYHKIYTLYKHINDRCYKSNSYSYDSYGGRGVFVCEERKRVAGEKGRERLLNFVDWCLNNGWGEGLELDRIDNDGPYAPSNCQFIPMIENLFYSKIDNATVLILPIYIKFYRVWESALRLGEVANHSFLEDFKSMVEQSKNRILRRAKILNIEFEDVR